MNMNILTYNVLVATKVGGYCHPLSCGINQETPRFIEGCRDQRGELSSLRMRGIYESVLEARLSRLVRRNKFQEAEELAKKFKLPIDQLYKVLYLSHSRSWPQKLCINDHL